MKGKGFLIAAAAILALQLTAAFLLLPSASAGEQDPVAVNHVLAVVQSAWEDKDFSNLPASPDYAVVGEDGRLLYRTREGVTETVSEAIRHRNTVLEVEIEGETVCSVIFYNDSAETLAAERTAAVALCAGLTAAGGVLLFACYLYLDRRLVKPFAKLERFAVRVADGNFDIPLEMDRENVFGAFSESFDLMRCELKKAREAEAEANRSKKELVAKLSHDIKTPVASIRAAAEYGQVAAKDPNDRKKFGLIEQKAEQIGALVTNLFSAALEDLSQLTVTPGDYPSSELLQAVKDSDSLSRAEIAEIPECLLRFDPLRLRQIFDNVISNSYKYADAEIKVSFALSGGKLEVFIEDFGGGVREDEVPLLSEKFVRGTNAAGKEGAGLGLYISRRLAEQMGGELTAGNTEKGFYVLVSVPLSRK